MSNPNAVVMQFPGVNCEAETAHAFELAGADASIVPVAAFESSEASLDDVQLLILPGGFSSGDRLGAGGVAARRLEHIRDEVHGFIEKGGLVLGICNGFQVLVESGLLPFGSLDDRSTVELTRNERGVFRNMDVGLVKAAGTRCVFLAECPDTAVEMPIAHAEGRFIADQMQLEVLEATGQVAFKYADSDGNIIDDFPVNPNGSMGNVAALTDQSGQILGMMPHPERIMVRSQMTNWRRSEMADVRPAGQYVIQGMVDYVNEA